MSSGRLGKRAAIIDPKFVSMSDAVAVMTGAMSPQELLGMTEAVYKPD